MWGPNPPREVSSAGLAFSILTKRDYYDVPGGDALNSYYYVPGGVVHITTYLAAITTCLALGGYCIVLGRSTQFSVPRNSHQPSHTLYAASRHEFSGSSESRAQNYAQQPKVYSQARNLLFYIAIL